jgi:hypothetical protein
MKSKSRFGWSLGESGKNFIETGKYASDRQSILIEVDAIDATSKEKQCRNANLEKAT